MVLCTGVGTSAAELAGSCPPAREGRYGAFAIAWLLDVVPPEYRQYGVPRRHPAALAAMARYYARGCVEGARAPVASRLGPGRPGRVP